MNRKFTMNNLIFSDFIRLSSAFCFFFFFFSGYLVITYIYDHLVRPFCVTLQLLSCYRFSLVALVSSSLSPSYRCNIKVQQNSKCNVFFLLFLSAFDRMVLMALLNWCTLAPQQMHCYITTNRRHHSKTSGGTLLPTLSDNKVLELI